MQRFHVLTSAMVGLGLAGGIASNASAAILYQTGFEVSQGWATGGSLVGQPASAASTERWNGFSTIGSVSSGGTTAPLSGVFAYNPVTPAAGQYALLQATNNLSGSSGFFFPNHNLPTPTGTGAYVPATNVNKVVQITFNMNVLAAAAGSTSLNDEFFGVVAYGGPSTPSLQISQLGLNNRTGAYVLPAGATVINSSPFGLGSMNLNVNHGYELLLNYQTNTWQIYSQLTSGVTPYILDAFGSFQNAVTTFTDADLAAYNLSTGASNGNALFDDYTVQTTPEPAALAVGSVAFGLLTARRRRMV